MGEFIKKIKVRRPVEEVFAWHERPDALRHLTPPWVKLKVVSNDGGIRDGAEVELIQKIGPFRCRWKVRHEEYRAGEKFVDRQVSGPFRSWRHEHLFHETESGGCELIDRIEFELRLGRSGGKIAERFVRRELERLFAYRHRVMRMDLETHPLPETERMLKVAITGATGLVGSHLTALLRTAGHEVLTISRGPRGDVQWDPENGEIDSARLNGIDAVVHLAGEPIAQRWTESARRRILESRRDGTRLLSEAILGLDVKPEVFVAISGVNAYGFDRPDGVDDNAIAGPGFLAEVCREWESASEPLEKAEIRRVILRSGMVLSPAGGALKKMLPVFRAGLGGSIGRGNRWMSWIAVDDLAAILAHAVLDRRYSGIFNATAPCPVKNKEFTERLASSIRRPAKATAPPLFLRTFFGEMAKETLLSDLRVLPARLEEVGYRFRFGHLEEALRHLLGRR